MKYIITILVTAIVVFAGAYIYFKGIPNFPFYNPNPVSTESAVSNIVVVETPAPLALPTASPAGTLIKAGGILSMSSYSIMIPTDWQYSKSGSVPGQSDKLTITKGTYSISISQGAFGGGICLYPGDPDQPMSQRFTSYTAVSDASGDSFRVGALATGGFVVCQNSNGTWGDITSFGHISISTPAAPDPSVLVQINSILATLTKS